MGRYRHYPGSKRHLLAGQPFGGNGSGEGDNAVQPDAVIRYAVEVLWVAEPQWLRLVTGNQYRHCKTGDRAEVD